MRSRNRLPRLGALVLALVLGAAAPPAGAQQQPRPGCVIKGNVSASGERIYHLPGGAFYNATQIDPKRGERWFCSEAEAQAAGWRRSRR